MSQAVKVGIFVIVCLVILAVLIFKIEDWSPFADPGQRVDAIFDSVIGLDIKAPVRVAGVRVGRVDDIQLDGQKARVSLLLEIPVPLNEGSRATISNAGILGDKFVELVLGPEGAPALPAGTVLPGDTPVTFDEALARFDNLGGSLQELTGDLSGGQMRQNIEDLIANLTATSADIRLLVSTNQASVGATVSNFERLSGTLAEELPLLAQEVRQLLTQIDSVVDQNRGALGDSLENVRELTEKVQVSVEHLNEISGQIASGEGSLGKLVYDDQAHDSLVSTLGSIEDGVGTLSGTLDRLNSLELELGLEGSYFTDIEDSRAAFSLGIANHPKRFYRVALVDDPRGRERTKTEIVTTTLPDGSSETTTIETTTIDDDFTLSIQLGYHLRNTGFRIGLFESSGGAAVDQYFFDRRLNFSLEAFDFNREGDLDPRLRFTTRWSVTPNIYVLGGYDDILLDDSDSLFIGAGIRWKDPDLKYLLGSVPSF